MSAIPIPDPVSAVDKIVNVWMTHWQTPGLAVVLHDPNYPTFANGLVLPYGVASLEGAQPPVTADTIFELASITKVFTSTLLALGGCALTDPVTTYLLGLNVHGGFGSVTLKALATHTSGLWDDGKYPSQPGGELFNDLAPLEALVAYWNGVTPKSTCWKYSNIGFVTLGFAVTQMFGKTYSGKYNDALAAFLTGPLGMNATAAQPQPSWQTVAQGYAWTSKGGNVPATGKANDLKSSPDDMLRFLQANLGVSAVPPAVGAALNQTQAVQGTYQQCSPAQAKPQVKMGLGWQIPDNWGNRTRYYKNGASPRGGQSCAMVFFRDLGYGVVVLTNQFVTDVLSITPPAGVPSPTPTQLAHAIIVALHPELGPAPETTDGDSPLS